MMYKRCQRGKEQDNEQKGKKCCHQFKCCGSPGCCKINQKKENEDENPEIQEQNSQQKIEVEKEEN